MTNRYKTLRKKLKELKVEVLYLFSLPPPGHAATADDVNHGTPPYDHQQVSEDIQQRFLFVKKLLSAEIISHTSEKPRHLRHISKRFEELESAFRRRDDQRRRFSGGDVSMGEDGMSGMSSVWSCDDEDEEDSCGEDECGCNMREILGGSSSRVPLGEDNSLNFPKGLVDVNVEQETRLKKKAAAATVTIITSDDEEEESNVKEEKKVDGTSKKSISNGGYSYWGGLISGMIFGAMLTGSFMFRSPTFPQDFLIPT